MIKQKILVDLQHNSYPYVYIGSKFDQVFNTRMV